MNLKEGKFGHTHLHTGRMPCDESRDKGNASKIQGIPKITGKGAEASNKHRIDSSSQLQNELTLPTPCSKISSLLN